MTERDVFIAALQKDDPAERAAFLDQACAGDAALRERVGRLLRLHEEAGTFLERPAAGEAATGEPAPGRWVGPEAGQAAEGPGSWVGPYKLLQLLGEGGMGAVYMAEQEQPVKRRVALKIIKPGMDSAQVLARFEAERQALALMDHPNIAKVLDAGATAAGRPYFVMELVKGVPITHFCDREHLTPRERLELFVPVCQAVQHAHQKGVIHRDLKPSNVLVALYDGRPVPKVIDFGVAKATGQKLTERTMFTAVGQVVGTLEYMSPEQAELNQLDVDTRSDVYSLGVLLYELLTGGPPFTAKQLRGAAFDEMLRLIREVDPPKPSTRLSGSQELPAIAAKRKLEPGRLTRLVRGELDWIVMKALEKERHRRYQTANGLARDVERYLHDEPVEACPPGAGYRLRKAARRYRKPLAAAAAFLLLLVLAAALTGWQALRLARAERDAAQRERDEAMRQARVVAEVQEALSQAAALRQQGKWTEAQAPLKRAEALLEGAPQDEELGERFRDLRRQLDEEERGLGLLQRLDAIRLKAANVLEENGAGAAAEYEEAFREYGLDVKAQPAEAAAARLRRSPIREDLVAGLDDWAARGQPPGPGRAKLRAVADAADGDPWRRALRDAVDRKDGARLTAMARDAQALAQPPADLSGLGAALAEAGLDDEAVALLRQAQARHPTDFRINLELASALLRHRPRDQEAVGYYRAALALRPDSPGVSLDLGNALRARGDLQGAIRCYRRAIALDPKDALAHYHLGKALLGQGHRAEAVAAFRQAVALGPKLAEAHCELGLALQAQGELAAALAALQTGHELGLQRKDWPYPSAEWVAGCAALAAASQGGDAQQPDEPGRARLRRQALACLRADLARRRDRLASGKPADRAAVRDTVERWRCLPDLAGVRDAAALAKLPAEEREAWQQFWADVAGLRAKAEAK
jgi:serine/threonine protein kinase/Flp pilus assembly protein TadD